MIVSLGFDGGGSHNGSPAGWGWCAFVDGHEVAQGNGALAPGSSNNEAEYTGLLMAARYCVSVDWNADHGIEPKLFCFWGDSLLVVSQVNREWGVKAPNLRPLWQQATTALGVLACTVQWYPRARNSRADELATLGRQKWTGKTSKSWLRSST